MKFPMNWSMALYWVMSFNREEIALETVDTSKLSSVRNVNGLLQFTISSYQVNFLFLMVLIEHELTELIDDSTGTFVTAMQSSSTVGKDPLDFKDLILLEDLVLFTFRSELKGAG